jgi:serine/threonine-protein kinase RsbT
VHEVHTVTFDQLHARSEGFGKDRMMQPSPVFDQPRAEPGDTTVNIVSDADIITARQQGRLFVLRLGFSLLEATLVATAISELARNIVLYAQHGEIVLRPLERNGQAGVLVIARDEGPGMADAREIASDGTPATHLGLRGIRRMMDELEIDSSPGRGTTVAVRKWKG